MTSSYAQWATEQTPEARENVSCPLCDGTQQELVMQARDRLFGRPGTYPIVECSQCSMRYVSPRPTLETIGEHYPDSYFIYKKLEDLPSFAQPMARSFADSRWRGVLARVEKALGPLSADTRIVDVGCGLNDYLAALQQLRGIEGIGVDFKPEVAAYVRDTLGMPCEAGTLQEAAFPDGHFDLVSMNEYLEHEPNPRQALMEARRITKPGGHVLIEIPFVESLPAKLFGSRWSQIDAPRHLVHFTRATLAQMLSRSGYDLVHTSSFRIPFAIGFSALQAMGYRRIGGMGVWGRTSVMLASMPFLPATPLLDEFLFAVGRAR